MPSTPLLADGQPSYQCSAGLVSEVRGGVSRAYHVLRKSKMEIQGLALKAINIGLQHYFRYTATIPTPKFDVRVEALDISIVEKKGEWRVSFAPNEFTSRQVAQRHKGMMISLNSYCLTFVIRKSDYKLTEVLGSQ